MRYRGNWVVYVARASDLRLNGPEFDPRPPLYRSIGTILGWVTIFWQAYHLGM